MKTIAKRLLLAIVLGSFAVVSMAPVASAQGRFPRATLKFPAQPEPVNETPVPAAAPTPLPTEVRPLPFIAQPLPILGKPAADKQGPRILLKRAEGMPPAPKSREELDGSLKQLKTSQEALKRSENKLEARRQALLNLIDVFIKQGVTLGERVERLNPPRGELEESILREIAADRAALENFRTEVKNARTMQELNQIARRIHEQHRDFVNKKVRWLMFAIFIGRLEKEHAKKLEARAERIETRLDELEAQGKDVSRLRDVLKSATDLIAQMLEIIDKERKELNQSEISEVRINELREILEGLKRDIHKVHQYFQEIYEGMENL